MIRITHAHGSTLLSPQTLEAQYFEFEGRGGWTSVTTGDSEWARFTSGLNGPLELEWEEPAPPIPGHPIPSWEL